MNYTIVEKILMLEIKKKQLVLLEYVILMNVFYQIIMLKKN